MPSFTLMIYEDSRQTNAVNVLKDKYAFRKCLKTIYPNYFFEQVNIRNISTLHVKKKCVIKPQKGFFGTAVLEIDEQSNMKSIQKELEREMIKHAKLYPDDILSTQEFLVEQFIEGEEYAVDLFYDENGNPVIVNLYHHPMPKHPEYLQMLYYSSKDVFDTIYEKCIDFFTKLNKLLNTKNFALHAEFRLNKEGLLPIEINPMRYGGMGLGTIMYYGLEINPYKIFANSEKVHWDKIWNKVEHKEAVYAYIIAYNGKTTNIESTAPNITRLKKQFTTVIKENCYDYKQQLTFGTFVLKETKENIKSILQLDFDDFFE